MVNFRSIATVTLTMIALTAVSSAWSADRIELDNTSIVGARELPKVLYIVPWKAVRPGSMMESADGISYEDGFTVLDRDVSLKEAEYYDILYGGAATPAQ